MGKQVRFDGSHKRDRFLTDTLGAHVDWVQVCPEVGAGMGVPRPTLRLIGKPAGKPESPRLVAGASGDDWTDAVEAYTSRVLDRLADLELCGFVLKSRSPTCGMERVRVYDGGGMPHKTGVGVFARALMARFPLLPVEEEGRLHDPALREAFLDAVFAYARWRALVAAGDPLRTGMLVTFHRRNKYLLRVHSPAHAVSLGHLVARGGRGRDPGTLRDTYGLLFMQAVKVRPTPSKHATLLHRMAGHLRAHISPGARALLHESIEDYRAGLTPRSVPVTLLRHHAQEHGIAYLSEQSYLDPYPKQLGRS